MAGSDIQCKLGVFSEFGVHKSEEHIPKQLQSGTHIPLPQTMLLADCLVWVSLQNVTVSEFHFAQSGKLLC